jgi:hypothetical protein
MYLCVHLLQLSGVSLLLIAFVNTTFYFYCLNTFRAYKDFLLSSYLNKLQELTASVTDQAAGKMKGKRD